MVVNNTLGYQITFFEFAESAYVVRSVSMKLFKILQCSNHISWRVTTELQIEFHFSMKMHPKKYKKCVTLRVI